MHVLGVVKPRFKVVHTWWVCAHVASYMWVCAHVASYMWVCAHVASYMWVCAHVAGRELYVACPGVDCHVEDRCMRGPTASPSKLQPNLRFRPKTL